MAKARADSPLACKAAKAATRSLLKNVTLNWNILPRNAWRKLR